MAVGPVKWAERWVTRAQRRGDLRAERFRRHEEAVRAGTEPPGFVERIGSTINQVPFLPRYVNSEWALEGRPADASIRLADAWLTWVRNGLVCGPDGVEVTIWIRRAGQDLPFHHPPDDRAWVKRAELPDRREDYAVCVRRMPAGPVESIRSFPAETSARWYAVELAREIRLDGITTLRLASSLPVRPPRTAGLDELMTEAIVGVGRGVVRGFLWLPMHARSRWRRLRTGR